ncbi:hypothetical protein Zmor_010177 [Zophobas morio]|uniref:Uncharacterized protein n=1 Tax=Zophobas morio TaxID=2755281 RepID=A0AA38IJX9_9CUCU|nr:hypothetical protein Zmor_010177 [Zophobas morio]
MLRVAKRRSIRHFMCLRHNERKKRNYGQSNDHISETPRSPGIRSRGANWDLRCVTDTLKWNQRTDPLRQELSQRSGGASPPSENVFKFIQY